ncbi:MAG TPA: cobalt ECF transporter T component CbiQ [Longilinea sp.]|nr:cobalt ECF transporter T component CbiQ [Longilinea sp.]
MEFSFPTTGRKYKNSFIERALIEINLTLEQSLYAETIARLKGLLQDLDPRLKTIGLLLFLFAVNLSHSLVVIIGLYAVSLVMAVLSKVPIGGFIKRVWAIVAVFTLIIALPAIFITPGEVIYTFPWGWHITQSGLTSAFTLLLRVGVSVSYTVLFVLTTAWHDILKALGILHVPDVILLTFQMTYRYIHLLLHSANDIVLSRKSRVLRRLNQKDERDLIASTSGVLLGKSLHLSEEVYLSMVSRGYHNYPRTMNQFHFRIRDWIAAFVMVCMVTLAIWLGR